MREYAVGIDLGGTNIKFVCLSSEGDLLCREQVETDDGDAPQWPKTIAETLEKLRRRQGASPAHIGLCAPVRVVNDAHAAQLI